jgi:hypothetical protein
MARGANFVGQKPANSGRKKGTPNTVTADIRERLAVAFAKGTDAMIVLLEDPDTDPRIRVEIWKTIGKKVLADLTSTTTNPDANGKPEQTNITVRFVNPTPTDGD